MNLGDAQEISSATSSPSSRGFVNPQRPGWLQEVTVAEAVPPSSDAGGMDRERLLNDILNTGVMGALIGGFALSNLQTDYDTNSSMDVSIYMLAFIGVHACTCSCVTSALLYRVANALGEDEAIQWASGHHLLLSLPMVKFGVGCICYLASVLLLSFRDLEGATLWRYTALAIGVMSMSMTLIVALMLAKDTPKVAVRSE